MKGQFDNISKGKWKDSSDGIDFKIDCEGYDILSIVPVSEQKSNSELTAFAGNLAQKYNIEHVGLVVTSLKYAIELIEGTNEIQGRENPIVVTYMKQVLKSIER